MSARIRKPRTGLTPRNVVVPIAAFVMAGILYTYSVTSIRAAKRNAKLHREADGGQLNMRNESLRRHGVIDQVQGTSGLQLFRNAGADVKSESEHLNEGKAKAPGESQKEEQTAPRTHVESGLEDYKGSGAAIKKFKEVKGG